MNPGAEVLVFDTGPMRHFALRGWLGVLKFLAGGGPVLIPESVEVELSQQRHSEPALAQVFDAEWIVVDRSNDLDYVVAFAAFAERLAVGDKNLGECGVLALGKTRRLTMVIDDGVPRRIAKEDGLDVTGTLGLLCRAIREEKLTVAMVEDLADDLLSGTYYLPFGPGGFRNWAESEGLLEYPER